MMNFDYKFYEDDDEGMIMSSSLEQVSTFYHSDGNQIFPATSDPAQGGGGGGEGGGEKKSTRRRRRRGKSGTGDDDHSNDQVGGRKRKLNNEQVKMLEENFGNEHKLDSERKDRLASQLGLDPRQVAVWFQNRRARYKSKKLEEQYSKLKNSHDGIIIEKCHLESEVIKLKEKVEELEKANMHHHQQQQQQAVGSSSSPHSALTSSMDEHAGYNNYDHIDYQDVFYQNKDDDYNNNNNNGTTMDWVNNLNYYYNML